MLNYHSTGSSDGFEGHYSVLQHTNGSDGKLDLFSDAKDLNYQVERNKLI
jgi:hypothetical protein